MGDIKTAASACDLRRPLVLMFGLALLSGLILRGDDPGRVRKSPDPPGKLVAAQMRYRRSAGAITSA
jgi:hypothetical protein